MQRCANREHRAGPDYLDHPRCEASGELERAATDDDPLRCYTRDRSERRFAGRHDNATITLTLLGTPFTYSLVFTATHGKLATTGGKALP